MATLQLQFSEVYSKVSDFLGWGSSPTGTDLTNAKNVVHRGYRRFLRPVDMRYGKKHVWSFLEKHTVLNTKSGEWIYNLPPDFHSMRSPFKHEKDSGYPELIPRTIAHLQQMRSGVESISYPYFYALKSGPYVKEIGSTHEVAFFETPNTNYRLQYSYIFKPPKLESDTDVFVGGDLASEVVLEHCLAVAEQEYDEVIGIHTQLASSITQELIVNDESTIADSVGKNIDPSVRYIDFQRPLPLTDTDSIY